jgi:hypothetical protein
MPIEALELVGSILDDIVEVRLAKHNTLDVSAYASLIDMYIGVESEIAHRHKA